MLEHFNTRENRIESPLKSMTASGLKLINLPALFITHYMTAATGNRNKSEAENGDQYHRSDADLRKLIDCINLNVTLNSKEKNKEYF